MSDRECLKLLPDAHLYDGIVCLCDDCASRPQIVSCADRMEEIERRRDNVLAEYNSDLPMYEPC